jgi:hypothetical protein
MANLTLRSVKGSPLTNAELDGNFEYFTGSHAITGSLTVSGSIIPAEVNGTLGTAEHPWKELFIDGATIVFISGSSSGSVSFTSGSGFNFVGGPLTLSGSSVVTSNQTGSFVTSGSSASTGSNNFTGTQTITGSLIVTGSLTVSGSNTFVNIGPMKTGDAGNIALNNSLAQGFRTTASGNYSHVEGYQSKAFGEATHAEGYYTIAGAPAWDTNSTSNGITQLPSSIGNITSSFTPGTKVIIDNRYLTVSRSFFQSNLTQIQYTNSPSLNIPGNVALAKLDGISYPNQTLILGDGHSEGYSNVAIYGHAEGQGTLSVGLYSHAEGISTQAIGEGSHAEGLSTIAIGALSHTEGNSTIASGSYQNVIGQYNTQGDSTSLLIVGNGDDITRRDAFKVRMSGSIVLPTTQSAAPSWTGTNGEMIFATISGSHYQYVWMGGSWKSNLISTGSNTSTGNQIITGSLTVTGSVTISGSNTFINVGPAQFSGSTETTQIDPLTDFWTNTFRPSKIQESSFAFTLGNSAYDGGVNPQLYTFNSRIVLPWTKKVKSYFVSNTLSGPSNLIANQLILPPLSNTGHAPGDVVSVYNMSNASFYDSGKIYLTSGMHGVTSVNASTKVIDGTYNNTALLSGSWGNYTNINVSNNPATSQSLALNPGQKATFEIIQWGDAISTPTAASASVTPGFGSTTYSANGYGDSQSVSPAIVYTLVYKLVSVSNL